MKTERQSDLLLYLWDRCVGIAGILCATLTNGDYLNCYYRSCGLGPGILLVANGCAVRHQRLCNRSVSNFIIFIKLNCLLFGVYLRFQRSNRDCVCRNIDFVVCCIRFKAVCYCLFNGPPADFDRVPMCSSLWCIRTNNNILICNCYKLSIKNLFEYTR